MLNIGIIGTGFIGNVHARAIATTPGVRIAAVCQPDPVGLAGFAELHGGTRYCDHRALLDDEAVDAVLVATPHHLHEAIACDAAAAGKHIMLEKPMAPTLAGCDRILAAVAAGGVTLMPGHTMRFTRACRRARQLIAAGAIGEPRFAVSAFIKPWMEPNRRDWHLRPETGGGMLMTAGIHALDRAMYLLDRPVTAVSAVVETAFHPQTADDVALLLLRFAGGGAAQVTSIGARDGGTDNTAELVGTEATMRLDFASGLSIGRGGAWTPVADSTEPDWAFRAIARQWQDFSAALLGGELPVTGADGRAVIAVILAALEAGQSGGTVAV